MIKRQEHCNRDTLSEFTWVKCGPCYAFEIAVRRSRSCAELSATSALRKLACSHRRFAQARIPWLTIRGYRRRGRKTASWRFGALPGSSGTWKSHRQIPYFKAPMELAIRAGRLTAAHRRKCSIRTETAPANRRGAQRHHRKLPRTERKTAERRPQVRHGNRHGKSWRTWWKRIAGRRALEEAVRRSLKELRGIYALVFLYRQGSTEIVAARLGRPL